MSNLENFSLTIKTADGLYTVGRNIIYQLHLTRFNGYCCQLIFISTEEYFDWSLLQLELAPGNIIYKSIFNCNLCQRIFCDLPSQPAS